MRSALIAVAVLGLAACGARAGGVIDGMVVNGSRGGEPAAGVEVVLRAGRDNQWVAVGRTTTDRAGRFSLEELDVAPGVVYQPGANQGGVHYAGPRLDLVALGGRARTLLTVCDTVEGPSPLVSESHQVEVEAKEGYLEVTEAVVVVNPGTTCFVGSGPAPAGMEGGPVTLALSLPEGVNKVTFNSEFQARNFELVEGKAATRLPWPPGKRRLVFRYQVPVAKGKVVLERRMDLATAELHVHVRGEGTWVCSLPAVPAAKKVAREASFEKAALAAGEVVRVEVKHVRGDGLAVVKWVAAGLLAGLIGVTAAVRRRRQPAAVERTCGSRGRARVGAAA